MGCCAMLPIGNIADECAISSRISALEMMVNKLLEQTHDSITDREQTMPTSSPHCACCRLAHHDTTFSCCCIAPDCGLAE